MQVPARSATNVATNDRASARNDRTDDVAARDEERARARQAAREKEEARARQEALAFRRRRIENLRERVATARAASERDERALEAAQPGSEGGRAARGVSRAALAEVLAALQAAEGDSEA